MLVIFKDGGRALPPDTYYFIEFMFPSADNCAVLSF